MELVKSELTLATAKFNPGEKLLYYLESQKLKQSTQNVQAQAISPKDKQIQELREQQKQNVEKIKKLYGGEQPKTCS